MRRRRVSSERRRSNCSSLSRLASKKRSKPGYWPFVRGIHRSPVDSPHKRPVNRRAFPCHDVIVLFLYKECIHLDNLQLIQPHFRSRFCRYSRCTLKRSWQRGLRSSSPVSSASPCECGYVNQSALGSMDYFETRKWKSPYKSCLPWESERRFFNWHRIHN